MKYHRIVGFGVAFMFSSVFWFAIVWASCGFDPASAAKFGRGILYQAADSVIYPVPICHAGSYPDCGEDQ